MINCGVQMLPPLIDNWNSENKLRVLFRGAEKTLKLFRGQAVWQVFRRFRAELPSSTPSESQASEQQRGQKPASSYGQAVFRFFKVAV